MREKKLAHLKSKLEAEKAKAQRFHEKEQRWKEKFEQKKLAWKNKKEKCCARKRLSTEGVSAPVLHTQPILVTDATPSQQHVITIPSGKTVTISIQIQ